MSTYDSSRYRALGVGERIESGDLYLTPAFIKDGRSPGECGATIGNIVGQDDEWTYLRPLESAPAAHDTYATGARRSASEGRGRFDLVPYEAMLSLARRYEMGAKVFGDRNWEQGQPLSRLLSSMRRHAHQLNYDFTEDHAGAVLWNAAAFVTMVARMEAGILPKELDDIGWFTNTEATKQ